MQTSWMNEETFSRVVASVRDSETLRRELQALSLDGLIKMFRDADRLICTERLFAVLTQEAGMASPIPRTCTDQQLGFAIEVASEAKRRKLEPSEQIAREVDEKFTQYIREFKAIRDGRVLPISKRQ